MSTQGGITLGADNNNDDYCDGDDMITTMMTIMIKIRRDGHRQGGATLGADTRTSRAHSLFAHWTRNKWLVVIIMKMVMIMIMMLLFFVVDDDDDKDYYSVIYCWPIANTRTKLLSVIRILISNIWSWC